MTNKAKIKGDKAEREAAALLSRLLGIRVERRFGAGQKLDTGDLEGIPNTVVQVCDLANKMMLYSENLVKRKYSVKMQG